MGLQILMRLGNEEVIQGLIAKIKQHVEKLEHPLCH